jgi:hypothetical protein
LKKIEAHRVRDECSSGDIAGGLGYGFNFREAGGTTA